MEDTVYDHLTQIRTRWSLLAQAHADANAAAAGRAALIERYQAGIYRYLLAAVRDPDAADELFQDFALKLVRGDFRNADPRRGRFRDFLKTSLINMVIDHQRKRAKSAKTGQEMDPAAPLAQAAEADQEFLVSWRKTLLDRTWQALEQLQQKTRAPYYQVMRLRAEEPLLSSAELARRLNDERKAASPYTDAGVRKLLQRAREMFSELLTEEVARTLEDPSPDVLEEEIIELGFQAWCREALQRRRSERSPSVKEP